MTKFIQIILSNVISCVYHLIMAALSLFGMRSLSRKVRQIYQMLNIIRYW